MWTVFDFCDPPRSQGEPRQNRVAEFTRDLPPALRAKLTVKISALRTDTKNEQGDIGPPDGVSRSLKGKYRKLHKIKIQGGPSGANTRYLVCRGPVDTSKEITILLGAFEKDNEWVPPSAPATALDRLAKVDSDSKGRRCPHEPIE